jgi:hypothetical protein
MDSAPRPLWVKLVVSGARQLGPFYSDDRTFSALTDSSEECQKATSGGRMGNAVYLLGADVPTWGGVDGLCTPIAP